MVKNVKKNKSELIIKNTITKLKLISFIIKHQNPKKGKKIEVITNKLERELNQ